MEIIPAIDLKDGKCVRLYQGDFKQITVFSEEPVTVALNWQAQGAPRLHVIDLDGAAGGELVNKEAIEAIVNRVNIPVQVGGGIRRLEVIEELLGMGVMRVVLGTMAVENTRLVVELCRQFGEAITVSLDARDGYIATHGWLRVSQITALELGLRLKEAGVKRLICTDIKRDGTLTEPNFEAVAELVKKLTLPIIASGGVSSLFHLERLKKLGVEGVIIGRALYTGDIKLREAIAVSMDKE